MNQPQIQSWLRPVVVALAVGCASPIIAQNPPASVAVDANANRRPISPNIYGLAYATTSDLAATNFTLNRSGGNSTSRYNWQIKATNRACDYFFESIADNPNLPTSGDDFVNLTRAANTGAQPLLTIPMLGYIAKLGPGGSILPSFSIAKYGQQTLWDSFDPDAGDGNRGPGNCPTPDKCACAPDNPIAGNNPLDAHIPNSVSFQQSWIQHLAGAFGTAANGGVKYYIMDNEPSLWNSTHRDVHPAPQTYDEMYNAFVTYAGAVRAAEPNAVIVGPEEWTWPALFLSGLDQKNGAGAVGSDFSTHNNTYYYPWLLQNLHNYQQTTGKQLLNVLSVHYYPPAPGGDDDSLQARLLRNRQTRSLWDPNYKDQSWFSDLGINNGIVSLIPTLRSFVSQYYPGLQTAITEYNWGDEANLSGATTQADVMGIYGREGLDLATRWKVPPNPSPTYLAMQIYRNYDGKRSTFGDTSVSAGVANPDNLSAFAAVRSFDGALTVMVINKQQGSTPVTISLANFATTGAAEVYQISSSSQTAIAQQPSLPVSGNSVATTVPSQSITLFVVPAGSVISMPAAPTGLSASVGSGSVTLTWNAASGATSYAVKRGTVPGGPYTIVGSAASGATLTFTDSGLVNGTTYYYIVSGSNSAGAGPNSAEVAGTPAPAPTFSSSASASPNPVNVGANTTIGATVTCKTNGLTNGIVQIYVTDPSGQAPAVQNFMNQNFTANQSHNYTMVLTPTASGAYTVQVGVFSATWQQWDWNSSAATVTVNSTMAFTSSAVSPPTVATGAAASISVTVTATGTAGLTNGNVELQIFNSGATAVATNVWSAQNFAAGQSRQYSYTWTPSSIIAPGIYSINVGVFDSVWAQNYYWNIDATISVTASQAIISCAPGSLSFSAMVGGPAPAAQTCAVTTAPSGLAVTSSVAGGNWLTATLSPGTSPSTLTVAVNPAGLAPKTYSASVLLSTPGASSAAVPVTLAVTQNRCDINGDGQVNVADVQALVNMVLGLTPATALADLNRDGKVDVADVQILVNVALGQMACP